MPKAKGSPKTGGRVKGVPNKVNRDFRETIKALLESNASNVESWLNEVANGNPVLEIKPDPARALDLLSRLAEYAAPKLARTEVVGDKDAPTHHVFTWKK